METLFQEKKKVKELQLKLSQSSSPLSTPSAEELAVLRNEVKSLIIRLEKSKIAEQQGEQKRVHLEREIEQLKLQLTDFELFKTQNAKLTSQLEESEEKLKQIPEKSPPLIDSQREAELERVVQFMRGRLDEVQSELNELEETLQKERKEKQELIEEEKALKGQLEQLRHALSQPSDEDKNYKEALDRSQTEIDLLKQMMMKSLQDSKEERDQEVHRLQSSLDALAKQYEESEQKYNEAKKALEDQVGIAEARHKQLLSLENNHHLTKESLEGQERAYQELAQFVEEMKAKLVESEKDRSSLNESLQKKEELIHNLSGQVANLSRNSDKLEETLRQHELSKQEEEGLLRQAQNHLAKKMRELAVLTEQSEALKVALEQESSDCQDARHKLIEMKAQYEADIRQKSETLKGLESQAAKWEEKYFQVQKKWQEVEAASKERFGKLQNAFLHLRNVMAHDDSPPAASFDLPPPAKTFTEQEMEPIAATQTSLFEPKSTRYKESLFG